MLSIGREFAMSGGSLVAADRIIIGNHVTIGANSVLIDTDFHPIEPSARNTAPQAGETAPVIIEDHVFIGMNCLVLKGVKIGQGSMVGAGSVVSSDIPAGVVAAGNPARVIRAL